MYSAAMVIQLINTKNKALHILKYAMIPILTISKDAHQEINCKN